MWRPRGQHKLLVSRDITCIFYIFLADLYYDIESNIYKMESVIQENDTSSLKQFLLSENARIQAELLQMKPAELAIASSVMTKPLLLRRVSESIT